LIRCKHNGTDNQMAPAVIRLAWRPLIGLIIGRAVLSSVPSSFSMTSVYPNSNPNHNVSIFFWIYYGCCFLLLVQSQLDFIAEHRAELKIGFLYKMLDSLEITVLWNQSIYSSLYLWLCYSRLWL